ncbi:Unknown protein [Arabidopsis thaliana]|uniref:At1g11210 n=3 Tax=Arabidopsis TaxID=3701 RepID=Q9SXA7_ARATH|nr:cotton fiber protein, putative (DUF761) [Arabidopsis thaliana]KAG7596642.1 hypothetical protein ISN44_As06g010740 [Arabidopsis suecica]AAD50003.1 Unknown protein [Arabidopsis thaliana]AAG40339.1 At1g11210 [Arabidopsis thaliana]AAK83623.1 At1g11210/T28P6_5 [Arabidopsis thaliana]AAL90950.1 At1g11210/T28P6_5 [Arabidopsis thaliana]|eukprot:NP_563885.1 cotton fiber protein, putative (DUF761) [Arabidopsis thaliana]
MASWMKAVLISTGVVATAMHLKVIVPVAMDFSQNPIILSSFLTWLKPPYLYVITNVIIIVVGVSYRITTVSSHVDGKDYEASYSGDNKFQTDHQQIVQEAPLRRRTETKDADFGFIGKVLQIVKEPEVVYEEKERPATVEEEEKKCIIVVSKSENQPPVEKPLVTARIGQKKPVVKTTPAERNSMRALRVAKPKRNETLENTWKMIMEGNKSTLPLTSYYKRPDTFGLGEETKQSGVLKKSETFSDRTNCYQSLPPPPPPLVKVKKVKVSRSRDELNRKVEAFIKKCNDERFASMKLDNEVARHGLSY